MTDDSGATNWFVEYHRQAKVDLLESVLLTVVGAIFVGLLHQSTGAMPTFAVGRFFDLTITAGDLQTVILILMLWPAATIVFAALYVVMTLPSIYKYSEKGRTDD